MFKDNSNSSNFLFILLALTLLTGCTQNKQVLKSVKINQVVSDLPENPQPVVLTPPSQPNTIWSRLLSLYSLPEINNERIDRELDWFLKHPKYLARVQERAEPYLYLILDEIEANQLPGELALLPVVESAFRPKAYSRSRAAGLWQFMPATGRLFGLKQNWWYDGRRDVYASTKAATLYLKQLNKTFDGDWLMALASYNLGKGNIRKAIAKNKRKGLPTDYWSLELPKETLTYVPRLLAIAKIFAHTEDYGITLKKIANKPLFEVVNIDSQLDLNKAAKMAQIEAEELLKLNPGFNRWCTDPNGPHRLLIPLDSVSEFKKNLAQLAKQDRMTWIRHKIKPGESLSVIAKKHDTSTIAIRQVNHLNSNRIRAGKHLLIPASHKSADQPELMLAALNRPINSQHYTVQQGDTFWRIAKLFSVSSKKIADWNNLPLNTTLHPGQKLLIQEPGEIVAQNAITSPLQKIRYTVKNGDSLSRISRKFNVTITDLRKWNSEKVGKTLHPGQKLKVMVDITQPAT